MSARIADRVTAHRAADLATAGPVVVAMGAARRSGRVADLVAWAVGAERSADLRRSRASRQLARVQVPKCLMAKPDVVLVFAPRDAAALPGVLCRVARPRRRIVVVSERGGEDAEAAARSVGAALVVVREVVAARGGCAHRRQCDRAVASAIVAALRDDWPPRRLMPLH